LTLLSIVFLRRAPVGCLATEGRRVDSDFVLS
jgi:hypothetical protein